VQEDVEHRTVTLAISATKFTGRVLKNAIAKLLAHKSSARQKSTGVVPRGKQSVKQLIGQNQGVGNLEIKDEGIKEFERVARKYGVDFAVKKVKGKAGEKPTYLVFFKGRDADALTSAFTEYTQKRMRGKERPSVLKALAQLKTLATVRNRDKVKNKEKEPTL
jgi:hypothetical protein